jgi:mycothiol system anti-sigma-R factor
MDEHSTRGHVPDERQRGGVVTNAAHDDAQITSCDDVLSHVFEFLDHETDDARRAVIAEHLEDCSPCLRQFGIEQEFKALVRRRCGGDPTPVGLRDRIKVQLTTVSFEEDGTQVWVERTSVETVSETPGERPSA